MEVITTLAPSTVIRPAMTEVADWLRPVLEPAVTVSARPVNRVNAPHVLVTAGEPLLALGGTHALYELRIGVAVIAGRFDTAGTWDLLLDVAETAFIRLETLPGTMVEPFGRVGPVAVAGVDYLAGILDLTVYRN